MAINEWIHWDESSAWVYLESEGIEPLIIKNLSAHIAKGEQHIFFSLTVHRCIKQITELY